MAHDFKRFPELTNSQFQFYYFESPHQQISEGFTARVEKVTDGDTIRVSCNFRDFTFPIRFVNINAPEMNEDGQESKLWLENLISGEDVYVKVNPRNRVGKFGRLIGEIILGGLNINEASLNARHSTQFGVKTLKQELDTIWL